MEEQKKYSLITRNLAEIIGENEIKEITATRPLKIYWGTAPTGQIHIAYLVPLLKIADFLDAGCDVTILLADLHAFLDAMKSTMDQLNSRTKYYEIVIKELLKTLNVDINNLKFVKGTDFQFTKEYTMDMYKINSKISVNNAKHAGAEVVKQNDNPAMTSLLYPVLQSLDEVYLNVDAQFGGIDQRKIFMFASEYLPKIGYKKRIHLMNPLIPGISTVSLKNNIECVKMSACDIKSKINVTDTPKQIKKKINSAYFLEGDVDDNTLIILAEKIVFPILHRLNKSFIIQKLEKFGGETIVYTNYNTVFEDLKSKKLHPADFKLGIYNMLIDFLEPVRTIFETKEFNTLIKNAYPV